jgi:IclR family pca regulon transcriptional regulator
MVEYSNNKDFLKTLSRGLTLIKSFDKENPKMTLSEVATRNSMSRASARRFVLTLESLGYLLRVGDYFQLTANILDIGHHFLENLNFIEIITPFMREVSHILGKACSASILNGTDIVYVARIPSQQQILSVNLNIGSHLPAYCTSMGRILLADLSDEELEDYFRKAQLKSYTDRTVIDTEKLRQIILKVKKDGYSLVNQELEKSLRAIAVPVRNSSGRVICSINVGIPVGQVKLSEITSDYLPVLIAAADKSEKGLVHHSVI